MMFGILGEDNSDVATLRTIVRRIVGTNVPVKVKAYDGCAGLLKKGSRDIKSFWGLGARRFVVCHDADKSDAATIKGLVFQWVVAPTGLDDECCIVVPVQEIEAWILADLDAVRQVVTGFRPSKHFASPEHIPDPKEHLEGLTRDERGICRYEHTRHNEKAANYLDLATVRNKCPSYRPFEKFVIDSAPPN